MKHPLPMTCHILLPGGRHCEATFTVLEEPRCPTPQEPDVRRAPLATEWAAILGKLMRMDFTLEEVIPVLPVAATPN